MRHRLPKDDYGSTWLDTMFINILRLVLTIVAGLIVFGWSLVAADQTTAPQKSILRRPAQNRSSVEGVVLESMPEIPKRPAATSRYPRPKLNLSPEFSRPDFGTLFSPRLKTTNLPIQRSKDIPVTVAFTSVSRLTTGYRNPERASAARRTPALVVIHRHASPPASVRIKRVQLLHRNRIGVRKIRPLLGHFLFRGLELRGQGLFLFCC